MLSEIASCLLRLPGPSEIHCPNPEQFSVRKGGRESHNKIGPVHGGSVDGSGWEGVYKILRRDGYSVSIVQNPTISLEDNVAALSELLRRRTDLQSSSATPTEER